MHQALLITASFKLADPDIFKPHSLATYKKAKKTMGRLTLSLIVSDNPESNCLYRSVNAVGLILWLSCKKRSKIKTAFLFVEVLSRVHKCYYTYNTICVDIVS